MQGSFGDIYDRLYDQLRKDIYYSDIKELIDEYEVIVSNSKSYEDEFVDIDMLGESQVMNINHELYNQMILFDAKTFIEKIIKSYKLNIERIECQFDMDYNRSELVFDNSKIIGVGRAIDKLKSKYAKYQFELCNQTFKLDTIISMICTQASFAFSFLLMNKVYSDYNKGIYVTSNNNRYVITNKNDTFSINLEATYNLKDTTNNTTIKQINVNTNIDFVYKNKTYELSKMGIISWDCLVMDDLNNQ